MGDFPARGGHSLACTIVHVTQVSVTGDNASIESTYVRFLRSKKFTPPNLFLSGAAVQAYISTLLSLKRTSEL